MKKKLLILLTLVFFSPFVVNAYEVKMEWQKNWGGSSDDTIESVALTDDGGLIAVGYSTSVDIEDLTKKDECLGFDVCEDAVIVKYDEEGNTIWQKSFGGNDQDGFYDVILTQDGGFIAVGVSESTDIEGLIHKGSEDAIIVKYDKNGNMLWQKNWGGNFLDGFKSVALTKDGGFVAVGYFHSANIEGITYNNNGDKMIVKYDKDGNMLWQKSWGGNGEEYFNSVISTEDGGLVVVGYSSSTDIEGLTNKGHSYTAIIVKFDKDGNILWQNSYDRNRSELFYSLVLTEDDGFIALGYTNSTDIEGLPNKGEDDIIIVKYDKDGNMLWQKSWGGNYGDYSSFAVPTNDGGFIAFGTFYSTDIEGITNKGDGAAIILKYDKDGNMLWQKSWGSNEEDYFESAVLTEDGGFVVVGKNTEDGIIIKYDKDGNLLCQKIWGGNDLDSFEFGVKLEDESLYAIGFSFSTDIEGITNKGYSDTIIVKYSIEYDLGNVETENGSAELKQEGKYGIIIPTPNEGYEVDKIIVKDNDGNVLDVEVTKQEDGTYSFELYTDVSVEVIYKEKIENPKTGIFDVITILFVGLVMSLGGFFIVKRYNERLEF